jgi:hypothetical protein
VHHARERGAEETLSALETLAAVRIGRGAAARAALVLARTQDAGPRYTLLERDGTAEWRVRWTSAERGC